MHDIDRTQLEVSHAEVQDEILRQAFNRVAGWLRRQPAAPMALPPPGGGYRGGPHDVLVRQIQAARAELEGMRANQAGAGSVAYLYAPMIREQEQRVARLEAELRRLQGGG